MMTMLAGRSNKEWTDQLDRLELPPGSSFDKEMAWEKLQERLTGKQKSRKRIWWIASSAAAMLVVVYLFLINRNQIDENGLLISSINRMQPSVIDKQKNTVPPLTVLPETITPKKNIDNNGTTAYNHYTAIDSAPSVPVDLSKTSELPAVDTVLSRATQPVAKKKMAVVHNNELEQQPSLTPPVKGNTATATVFFPDWRKYQDLIIEMTDTLNETKPKRKLLPFSSLISQKQ